MTENEAKIKELQKNIEDVIEEREKVKVELNRLSKEHITLARRLQDEERLNERYLQIIENLTKGK